MGDRAEILRKDSVLEYYRLMDAGQSPMHLFADGFQFYFPKYGIGRGIEEFSELAEGVRNAMSRTKHRIDELLVIAEGNHVAVEGTTEGADAKGQEWRGGETPGGRFCSMFSFDPNGLISRMHIYLDPDYTGEHGERFLWPDRKRQEW